MRVSVSVSGSIAAGKTNLCNRLSEITGMPVVRESVDDNPFLKDFYADPHRWSLVLQMYFLSNRLRSYTERKNSPGREEVVQDRTIFEDPVFARALVAGEQMEPREFATYNSIYEDITSHMEIPPVVVFLNVSPETCLERIRSRHTEPSTPLPIFFSNTRAFQSARVRAGQRHAGLPPQAGHRVRALRRADGNANAGDASEVGEVRRCAQTMGARV